MASQRKSHEQHVNPNQRRGKDESEKRRNQQQGEDSSQGQQGSGHRGSGNFAENRERASEAGRKGDKS